MVGIKQPDRHRLRDEDFYLLQADNFMQGKNYSSFSTKVKGKHTKAHFIS